VAVILDPSGTGADALFVAGAIIDSDGVLELLYAGTVSGSVADAVIAALVSFIADEF